MGIPLPDMFQMLDRCGRIAIISSNMLPRAVVIDWTTKRFVMLEVPPHPCLQLSAHPSTLHEGLYIIWACLEHEYIYASAPTQSIGYKCQLSLLL